MEEQLRGVGSGPLDEGYIADAGQAVARYWRRGRTVELAYTPGNGTLYDLVLVPVGSPLESAQAWMDHAKRRSIRDDRPEWNHDEDSLVLLGWVGHGFWQVDLRAPWHESYLCEKFADCTVADAFALRKLLVAIGDHTALSPVTVVR